MTAKAKANWIDQIIGFVDPQAGYERLAWRKAFNSSYDSGSDDRLNSGWTRVNATAEQTNQSQRDSIRARARDLERNSDIAEAIIGPLVRNIVGDGFQLQAKITNPDGSDNEPLNQIVEEAWQEWCKVKNCDISGQQSFSEMLKMAVRRIEVDGGILFIKSYTPDGQVPFVLQAREVDDIDSSLVTIKATAQGNRIINGIEVDKYNKPVAFWLKTVTADGLWMGNNQRVPADRVLYLYDKKRPSQIREISKLAATAGRIRDINEFTEAVSVKERILACLSVWIKKLIPSGMNIGRTAKIDQKSGYENVSIAPGMINELQPGDEIQVINPSGQASNAKEFITTELRLAAAGQGLSYVAASRDMSQVNYSSARSEILEDQKTYKDWQKYLEEHFADEVYTEWFISAILAGTLPIKDFWANKKRYLKHIWIRSGWSWIDPLKEVKANEAALATNQTTLANICNSAGMDWREVLKQRAKENDLARELGLISNSSGEANNEAEILETQKE